MITFVTGIYGAGKTTYAKSLPGRYVPYDEHHDYTNPDHDPCPFLDGLQHGDVVDAIPFRPPAHGRHHWDEFLRWSEGRSVHVVVAVCGEVEWRARVGERVKPDEWAQFWVDAFGLLDLPDWVHNGKRVSAPAAAALVDLDQALRSYVTDYPASWHDAKYQDMPCIGLDGYSESSKTWDTVRDLAHWAGKRVVDAGANHGYFCRAAEDEGAIATGLERHPYALAVARCASRVAGSGCEYLRWSAGDPMPAADVLLCLNAIHHFGDAAEAFLVSADAPLAIFEAGTEWESRLRRHYHTVEAHPSHREGRAIYRCEK